MYQVIEYALYDSDFLSEYKDYSVRLIFYDQYHNDIDITGSVMLSHKAAGYRVPISCVLCLPRNMLLLGQVVQMERDS